MTNDWDGLNDRRKRPPSSHFSNKEREWLVTEIHELKRVIDLHTEEVKVLSRRVSSMEEAVIGTTHEPGIGEMRRTISFIRRIIYGAVSVLMTALLLKTFFNYKG